MNSESISTLSALLALGVGLIGAIILFIILREVTTWYFKLTEIVTLLKSIDSTLISIRKPKDK